MLPSLLRRGRRCLALLLLASASLVVCVMAPRDAMCQAKAETRRSSLLDSGKKLFDERRYEESIQTLSAALLRPGTSKDERVEVYRHLAYNYLVLSREKEAEAAVRGLYVLEPDFTLGASDSPRFRTFFGEVKARWETEGRPGLEAETRTTVRSPTIKHVSPAEWERGKQLRITGQIVDPANRVASVVIRYRSGSPGQFQRLEARLGQGHFRTSIPGTAVKPPMVEYYIEGVDDDGLPIASRGDVAAPLRIAIPDPDEGASVISSPWFWVAAAVVVASGVTAAILLNNDSGSSSAPSAPTTSSLIVTIGN